MAKFLIRRYIWLIDTIRSCPEGISFREINRQWERSSLNDDGLPMPKRTFHAHIEAILDEFDIEIVCDRSNGYRYKIEDEISEYGSIRSTLVDSLVLGNAVAQMPAMKNHVVISTGFSQKDIAVILNAIKQNKILKLRHVYMSIRDDIYEVEPYGIVYHQYWFLVCNVLDVGEIGVFALDRLTEVKVIEKTLHIPEDFNLRDFMETFDHDKTLQGRIDRGSYFKLHDDFSSFEICRRDDSFGVI